jgi:hypothetical protein
VGSSRKIPLQVVRRNFRQEEKNLQAGENPEETVKAGAFQQSA